MPFAPSSDGESWSHGECTKDFQRGFWGTWVLLLASSSFLVISFEDLTPSFLFDVGTFGASTKVPTVCCTWPSGMANFWAAAPQHSSHPGHPGAVGFHPRGTRGGLEDKDVGHSYATCFILSCLASFCPGKLDNKFQFNVCLCFLCQENSLLGQWSSWQARYLDGRLFQSEWCFSGAAATGVFCQCIQRLKALAWHPFLGLNVGNRCNSQVAFRFGHLDTSTFNWNWC